MLSVFPWTEEGIGSFFSVPEAPLFYRSFQFHFRWKLFEELRGKGQINHANGKPYKAQNHGIFIQIDPDHKCEDGSDDRCDEITENVKAFSMSAFDKVMTDHRQIYQCKAQQRTEIQQRSRCCQRNHQRQKADGTH